MVGLILKVYVGPRYGQTVRGLLKPIEFNLPKISAKMVVMITILDLLILDFNHLDDNKISCPDVIFICQKAQTW